MPVIPLEITPFIIVVPKLVFVRFVFVRIAFVRFPVTNVAFVKLEPLKLADIHNELLTFAPNKFALINDPFVKNELLTFT